MTEFVVCNPAILVPLQNSIRAQNRARGGPGAYCVASSGREFEDLGAAAERPRWAAKRFLSQFSDPNPESFGTNELLDSGRAVVAMMQAAQSRHGDHRAGRVRFRSLLAASWRLLRQPKMGPILVIVPNVVGHEAFEMADVEHDDMIEQIATAGADESFGHAVLPRASNRNSNWADAEVLRRLQDFAIECVFAIKDEKLRCRIVGEALSKLLSHPRGRRMPRDVVVKNAPPVMSNHEEAIQHAECCRGNREEIHACDGLSMIAQERRPSLCRLMVARCFPHPTQHRSLGDFKTKHLQFTMNPRCAPGAILGDHAEDQFPKLLARRLSSDYGMFAREPFPVQPESGPVPADNRIRLYDDKRLLPSRPESAQRKVDDKSNEITAIPKLLDALELSRTVVTHRCHWLPASHR